MSDYFELMFECLPDLMAGLGATLLVAIASMFFAFIIGMVLALMGLSNSIYLRSIYHSYVAFIRGVPVLIFALFLFFGVGGILNIQFNPIVAGIITLSINASAFLAEIFRGGIMAVDKGQVEASRSLGFGYFRTMRYIVLPQALRIMVPPIINQFISTLKDTSILSVISVRELTMNSQIIIARNFRPFEVYSYTAIIYFIVILIIALFAKVVEKKLNSASKNRSN